MSEAVTERERTLTLAIEHHMAGRLDEAERLYLALHQRDSQDEEVLYLMGVLCRDLGIYETACKFLEAALEASPNFSEAARQLVAACAGLADQRIEEGRLEEADRALQRGLFLAPDDAMILRTLGRLALVQGDAAQAQHFLERARQHDDNDVDTLNWLGLTFLQQLRYVEAQDTLERVIAMAPDLNQARNNLGLALHHQGRLSEALAVFEAALAQEPDYVSARTNLANTLRIVGRRDEALRHLQLVVAAQPQSVEALNNLATVLQDLGRPQEAKRHLEAALVLPHADGMAPQLRWNLALSQLLLGEVDDGWTNFEYRWEGCANLRGAYDKPPERAWRGEPLAGKRLLVWAEQGYGDTLQFIRFAEAAARLGAAVIAEVQAELAELLRSVPGLSQVVARGDVLPDYDVHCPLMSLPYRLGHGPEALPPTPYLFANPVKVARWRARLADYAGFKVGLVWAGNSRKQSAELAAIDARRSVRLQQLAPLLTGGHCCFFSLQKGAQSAELATAQLAAPLHDFSAEWADFSDTAAFVANLDLVISVDTAVAHLAGALGRPVWLLNRHDTCWRWLLDRNDSPWYPTLRQFRQTAAGEWEAAIAALADELARLARQLA